MSLPPQLLRIKRKREDEPVDALYIETENKRRNTDQKFVFRRVPRNEEAASTTPLARLDSTHSSVPGTSPAQPTSGIPSVIATRPGDENAFDRRKVSVRSTGQYDRNTGTPLQNGTTLDPTRIGAIGLTQPRRFHLSIDDIAQTKGVGRRKHKTNTENAGIVVFVEEGQLGGDSGGNAAGLGSRRDSSGYEHSPESFAQPRKRPGAAASVSRTSTPTPGSRAGLGNGQDMHDALQRFAMEELVVPRTTAGADIDPDAMDIDVEDGEYIYETYVRQPFQPPPNNIKASSTMDTFPSAPSGVDSSIGYLVISESSSSYFFTNDAADSDDDEGDWDSEQDDENAENFYGADYPEEEVDSDDEKNIGAYEKYRRTDGGGSDDEEWGDGDEDEDDARSGDEADSERMPWEKRPKGYAWERDLRETYLPSSGGLVFNDASDDDE